MLAQSSQLPKDLNKMQPIICIDGQSTELDIPKNQVLSTGGTAGLFSAVQLIPMASRIWPTSGNLSSKASISRLISD